MIRFLAGVVFGAALALWLCLWWDEREMRRLIQNEQIMVRPATRDRRPSAPDWMAG